MMRIKNIPQKHTGWSVFMTLVLNGVRLFKQGSSIF